jgi:hypothetical protein
LAAGTTTGAVTITHLAIHQPLSAFIGVTSAFIGASKDFRPHHSTTFIGVSKDLRSDNSPPHA